MSTMHRILGTMALAVFATTPVAAQERALVFEARAGGYNGFTHLNSIGTLDSKKVGYTLGTGVAVDLFRHVALRGDFTFARNQFRTNGLADGIHENRFFYDGAVQFEYPISQFTPYAFAGGGAVTLHQVGTAGEDRTKGTGTFGLGVNYRVPGSELGLFVEGKGWLYKPSNVPGFLAAATQTQTEMAWAGGVSYRLPL